MPIRANIAVYQSKYSDMHRSARGINADGVPFIGTTNAAEATIEGLQVETAFMPIDRLQINFNYGYLDPRYDKGTEVFSKKNKFARAPEHTVNASVNYSWPVNPGGEIFIFAGYTYQSEITFTDSNLGAPDDIYQKGYALVDAKIGWNQVGGGPFDIGFYGKNIADEEYALDRQDNRDFLGFLGTHYNVPRTYGIEVRYSFGR
jgi:iron complex outermembrane receptor protein